MTRTGGPKSPRKRVVADKLTEAKRLRQLRKALKELVLGYFGTGAVFLLVGWPINLLE
jgi:hypothetical protein